MVQILLAWQLILRLGDLFIWSFLLPWQSPHKNRVALAFLLLNHIEMQTNRIFMVLWLWVKGYRCSCSGSISFWGITRGSSQYGARCSPSLSEIWNPGIFRDYSVHMGNNQSFKVFSDDNDKGGTSTLLWMSLFIHRSPIKMNPSLENTATWEEFIVICGITHILTKVMSFAFVLASLQVCWWVFMGEKEQVRAREKHSTRFPTRGRQTSVLHYFRGLLYWCSPVTLNRA